MKKIVSLSVLFLLSFSLTSASAIAEEKKDILFEQTETKSVCLQDDYEKSILDFPQNQVLVVLKQESDATLFFSQTTQNKYLQEIFKKWEIGKESKTFPFMVSEADASVLLEREFLQPYDIRWKLRQLGYKKTITAPPLNRYYTLSFSKDKATDLKQLIQDLKQTEMFEAVYPDFTALKNYEDNAKVFSSMDWVLTWLCDSNPELAAMAQNALPLLQKPPLNPLIAKIAKKILVRLEKPVFEDPKPEELFVYENKDPNLVYFQGRRWPVDPNTCKSVEKNSTPCVENQLFVSFFPSTSQSIRKKILDTIHGQVVSRIEMVDVNVVKFEKVTMKQALQQLEKHAEVLYAEPIYQNYTVTATSGALVDDEYYVAQWDFFTMDMEAAWAYTTGSKDVIVAVIDTGIADHEDFFQYQAVDFDDIFNGLYAKDDAYDAIYNNSNFYLDEDEFDAYFLDGCAANNRRSCDGNANFLEGDMFGWNFADATPYQDDDSCGHGTAVAGIIGSRTNNMYDNTGTATGVAGMNWEVSLLPLDIGNCTRNSNAVYGGNDYTVAEAIAYAAEKGAKVVNMSIGRTQPSETELKLIQRYSSILFVAAANQDTDGFGHGSEYTRNGNTCFYPACYSIEASNVMAVASHDRNDNFAEWSDYGEAYIAIAAPGEDIKILRPNNSYSQDDGNSFATPHVSGVAALLWAYDSSYTVEQVMECIVGGSIYESGLSGKVANGNRLSVSSAISFCDPPIEENKETGCGCTTSDDGEIVITLSLLGSYNKNEVNLAGYLILVLLTMMPLVYFRRRASLQK